LLVEADRGFDSVHPEGQVGGDVAALGHLNEDRGGACWVARGSVAALPDEVVHGAEVSPLEVDGGS
jgi:hypothetical protein